MTIEAGSKDPLEVVVAGIKEILTNVDGPRGQEQGSDFETLDR